MTRRQNDQKNSFTNVYAGQTSIMASKQTVLTVFDDESERHNKGNTPASLVQTDFWRNHQDILSSIGVHVPPPENVCNYRLQKQPDSIHGILGGTPQKILKARTHFPPRDGLY